MPNCLDNETMWAVSGTGEDFQCVDLSYAKELVAEIERLRADLKNIATQKTTEELAAQGDDEDADYEGGYDALIHIARRSIQPVT